MLVLIHKAARGSSGSLRSKTHGFKALRLPAFSKAMACRHSKSLRIKQVRKRLCPLNTLDQLLLQALVAFNSNRKLLSQLRVQRHHLHYRRNPLPVFKEVRSNPLFHFRK
jgi:hypothetical protein